MIAPSLPGAITAHVSFCSDDIVLRDKLDSLLCAAEAEAFLEVPAVFLVHSLVM